MLTSNLSFTQQQRPTLWNRTLRRPRSTYPKRFNL